MGKESDRRKKRLKGNQIEIPRCRYRGCSRYGVYKWKAMNRWIRGKEIKAEAEWTARWVFRYDKSPRKSPFLPSRPFFSVFSAPRLIPHPYSLSPCRLPPLFLILSAFFSPFLSLLSSFFFFFYLTVLAEEEVARLFDSRIDTPMRGSEAERDENDTSSRMNFPSTVIETPFSAYEVSRTTRGYSEIFRQPIAFR